MLKGGLLLIFPDPTLGPRRIWHRTTRIRKLGGSAWRLPGLHRAVPSVPLDELRSTVQAAVSACVTPYRHVDGLGPFTARLADRAQLSSYDAILAGNPGRNQMV